MKKKIILLLFMMFSMVGGELKATTIDYYENVNIHKIQNIDNEYSSIYGSAVVLNGTDWDINEDTVISEGEYNLVRVDYNNPTGNTKVIMYGGSITAMHTYYSSIVNYSSGSMYSIDTLGNSEFYFSGGNMSYMRAHDNSNIFIIGRDFNYEFGEIADKRGRLTGTLKNGDTLYLNFEIYDNSAITLIPEPINLSLLSFGCFIFIRKRYFKIF